jgi:hypothetical protein
VLFLAGSERGEVREKWVIFSTVDSKYVVGERQAAWQIKKLARFGIFSSARAAAETNLECFAIFMHNDKF